MANRARLDGLEVLVQQPKQPEEELAYGQETVRESSPQMEVARARVLELWHHRVHGLAAKQRTEIALDIVPPLAQEGHVPHAHDAFNHGVLSLELRRGLEHAGTHWVSALACSHHIQWQGQWRRGEAVAHALRPGHPDSFRAGRVCCRTGATQPCGVVTKVVRCKRYGRKRLGIVHEQQDLGDPPRVLLTEAWPGDSGRVIETWSDRWAADILHAFGTQECGLEAAQVRKEAAVQRHFRWRGVAQSWLQ
jgi:hypothetical protein